jgi:hypothetical protein
MTRIILSFIFFLSLNFGLAQTKEQYLVSSQTLNMRKGPGKQHAIVATLSKGDEVTILDKAENDWWKVSFEDNEGYVFSQLLVIDPYSDWEKKNYQSGTTPECENVNPKYDNSINNYLKINVGSGTDVVLKLIEIGNTIDQCIRVVYVRSGDTYEIKNIPEGRYYLKIAYGKDFRQKKVDNQCLIKFLKNAQYEKGVEILDFYKIRQPDSRIGNEVYKNWSIPSFELMLDVIVTKGTNSSFKSSNISELEFNR